MTGVVLVTSRSFSSGEHDGAARLAEAGLRIVTAPHTHTLDDLAELLPQVDAWIAGTGPVTEEHFALAPKLRIVARYGVGVDAVDVEAAARRGVLVANTPAANSESVAELAFLFALLGLRRVTRGDAALRRGDWSAVRGAGIEGRQVGVVGYGRIGRGFARRAIALGASVSIFDPWLPEGAEGDGVTRVHQLAELASVDVVSLHSPGGETLVDAVWLARADGLVLVNTARADLVDEHAVAEALRDGRLASYAADTLSTESAGGTSPLLAEELRELTTFTPHLGAQTVQAIDMMTRLSVDAVLDIVSGREPAHLITV